MHFQRNGDGQPCNVTRRPLRGVTGAGREIFVPLPCITNIFEALASAETCTTNISYLSLVGFNPTTKCCVVQEESHKYLIFDNTDYTSALTSPKYYLNLALCILQIFCIAQHFKNMYVVLFFSLKHTMRSIL